VAALKLWGARCGNLGGERKEEKKGCRR